jgi:demethoxyubiquinone hydroxylase (CLK1/Coq7/Cat5 family)
MSNQIDRLNALIGGELSAVECYSMVIAKAKTPTVIAALTSYKAEHQQRIEKLSQLLTTLGGTPTTKSGAWGAFAKIVEAGAVALGETSAIGTLKEGEDHGVELYRAELKHLDGEALALVQNELLPAQEATQKAVSSLSDQY